MRLIDADAVLKGKNDHEMISTHVIWNAPTVDAEPIVRCKDCKFRYGEDGEYNPNDLVCTYWESDGMTERDFCSQGEPRK